MALRAIFLFTILCFQLIHCKVADRLSCQQIKQFVDGHNARRLQLSKGEVRGQPAASEMKYMVWDDELAAKASMWAAENLGRHNLDKTIPSGRFKVGENLYWYSTSDPNHSLNVNNALNSWWEEHKDYKFTPLRRSDFESDVQIGHYTQMAWSDTIYVGCGALETQTRRGKEYFVVCNYGPSGNTLGRVPYKPGSPSGKLVCATKNCNRPYGSNC